MIRERSFWIRVPQFVLLGMLSVNTAFGIGEIEIPSVKRTQLENEIGRELGVTKIKAIQYRLGGADSSSFDFKLGRLEEVGFKKIKSYFSFPLNSKIETVPYNPKREYWLSDFLLPKIQAPLKLTFQGNEVIRGLERLTGSKSIRISPETNCWSTGYDLLRSSDEPLTSYIYVPEAEEVTKLLKSKTYSKIISAAELRPYDYVMYFARENGKLILDHVAVSLGPGLVFEKTGNTEMMDYYQIQPLEDVTKLRKDLRDGNIEIEYRRLTKPLPHPYSVWSAKAKNKFSKDELDAIPFELRDQLVLRGDARDPESYDLIRPLSIVKDPQGNYRFNPSDKFSRNFYSSRINGFIVGQEYGYSDAKLHNKACRIIGELNVKVVKAEGQNFYVAVTDYQVDPDNRPLCKDTEGKEVKKFWVPVSAVRE